MKLPKQVIQRAKSADLPSLIYVAASAAGVLCLLASFRFPWFPLPAPALSATGAHYGIMRGVDAPCTLGWKIALALALAGAAVIAWRLPAGRRRSAVCVALGCITAALLFYPCSLLYFAPVEASRANWIELQHRNITSPGGDISSSAEVQNRDWKIQATIVDLPRQVGAVQIPKSIPSVLELGRVSDAVEWLGYSDAFCSFAGAGWMLAVAGTALLLAAAARGCGAPDFVQAKVALTAFGATGAALFLLASAPVLITGFAVGRAHAAIQLGDYDGSRRWLEVAAGAMPVIRENSFFIIQEGLIDDKLNRDTLEAAHYRALCLENGEFYSQAEAAFRDLLARAPANSAIWRETLRDLLRMAVRDMKSDELQRSLPLFELVIHSDPDNLKANHCLQIAYLRLDRFTELQELITSMRQIYGFMGNVTKLPALGACLDTEALLRFHKGNLEGALADRRTSP